MTGGSTRIYKLADRVQELFGPDVSHRIVVDAVLLVVQMLQQEAELTIQALEEIHQPDFAMGARMLAVRLDLLNQRVAEVTLPSSCPSSSSHEQQSK